MLSVEAARSRILAGLSPTGVEVVALSEGWRRVTAAPVAARLNQPPTDVSAMDGYAVRAADAEMDATLRVVGSAPAGHPWSGCLAAGEALRVFTGSVMPDGADAVLLQEDAVVEDETVVRPTEAARAGRHIRRAAHDFAVGDVLLPAGRRLTARDVGLAAAANHPWLLVHRRPRVAILATGDEIALPGEAIPPGGIISSNAHMLAALARACGGEATVLPVALDDPATLARAIDMAAGFDLLLTSGGASVGDHDLVRPVLQARGMALDFWRIAMRPGKPLMHGWLGAMPVLGLPGNPVSSFVTALLFVWPALRLLAGEAMAMPEPVSAVLGRALPANDARADHLRARLDRAEDGRLRATPFDRQDSSQSRLLASADALVLRPAHAPAADAGEMVAILPLDQLGL